LLKSQTEIKYNKTSRFLLPALRLEDKALIEMGLVNAFLQDNEYDIRWDLEGCLFLLFKPNKLDSNFEEYCDAIRQLTNFKDEYDVEDGIMMVLEIPDKYKHIINTFVEGQYSKMDKSYVKECIPQFVSGKLSKRWKIFYRDKSVISDLAKELGYSDEEAEKWIVEVEDKPYAEDEIYRYNPEINTNLTKRNGNNKSASS